MLLDDLFFSSFYLEDLVHQSRSFYNYRLKKSLEYICNEGDLDSTYKSHTNFFSLLNPEKKYSPELYLLNKEILDFIKEDKKENVEYLLNRLPSESLWYKSNLVVRKFGIHDWDKCVGNEVSKIDIKTFDGNKASMWTPSDAEFKFSESSIREAIDIISSSHPLAYEYLEVLASEIVVFQGFVAMGLTDVKVFGSIFIRVPESYHNPVVYFCEHLIHESAHLYLHTLFAADRIILNDNSHIYDAPIREDKRHMYGIFHATFVLHRMIEVFSRIKNNKALEKSLIEDFNAALELFYFQFLLGYETVKKYAILTEKGKLILKSFSKIAKEATVFYEKRNIG